MTDGWVFLGISAVICAGAFAVGLRFARMDTDPRASGKLSGPPLEDGDMVVAQANRFGRLMMIGSVIMLVFVTALTFGLLGPVEGIKTIDLGQPTTESQGPGQ